MEVIYKFDFKEGSDDHYNLRLIQKATHMYLALSELAEKFRAWYKWDEREAIPTEEIKDTFWDILAENDVNLDRLGG